MKNRLWSFVMAAAFLSVLFGQFTGCSITGLVIGGLSDLSTPPTKTITGWTVEFVKPGMTISLSGKDGSIRRGVFSGIVSLTPEQYAERYRLWREQDAARAFLPDPGEILTASTTRGTIGAIEFIAFDSNDLVFHENGQTKIVRRALNQFQALTRADGRFVDKAKLTQVLAGGGIPSLQQVRLRTPDVKYFDVPLNDIAQAEVTNKRYGKLTGFLTGLAIDGLIVAMVLVISATKSSAPYMLPAEYRTSASGGKGSCPFVYSFDGRDYVLDSETFSGAVVRSAQRADWDNLDHLKAVDGIYRLRVRNEMPEVQYIDSMKLLVVDHEPGTVVAPEFNGTLHTLRNLKDPVWAEDAAGSNVLALVAKRDDRLWTSNPFGRDPDDPAQVRDGLTIEFDRPAVARTGKLLFTVQNTAWAAYAEAYLSQIAGSRLGDWRALMDASAPAREAYRRAVSREAMLGVQIWNGTDWTSAGSIWFVGPSLSKDLVVPIDLSKIGAGPLRVRLESTAGLWMIDRVQADFGAEGAFTVAECPLLEAKDLNGRDLRGTMASTDGDYFVLSSSADQADLSFRSPDLPRHKERSFILITDGYYLSNGAPQEKPQLDLLASFNVPGAFGRHMLKMLNEELGRALSSPAPAK
jgi:hypothetical protein